MKGFFCAIVGHKYLIDQEFGPSARRLYCPNCSTYFAMNDRERSLLEWDSDFHGLYKRLGFQMKYTKGRGNFNPLQENDCD